MAKNIIATINGQNYTGTLEPNATAQAFAAMLPAKFLMNELNGNEKYIYLDAALPVDAAVPTKIQAGDLMLYEDNCLVVFYRTFRTTYRYTKIGHIDALPNLGDQAVQVQFALGD